MNPYPICMSLVYVIYIHRCIDITFNGSNVVNASLLSPAGDSCVDFCRVKDVNDATNMGMCRLLVFECLAVDWEHIHNNAVVYYVDDVRRLEVVWHGRKFLYSPKESA